MALFAARRKQEVVGLVDRGAGSAPVAAQYVEQAWGKHGVTVFVPFALLDADEAAFGIDIGNLEGDGFADAQSSAVTGHEGGAVLEALQA